MNDLKTVEVAGSTTVLPLDPLSAKQREDVAKMRASLLACTDETMPITIQQVTVRSLIHQLTRIVKYTELMDKIEDSLYTAIGDTLDSLSTTKGIGVINTLLTLQERLQDSMIASNRIMEPYLKMFNSLDIPAPPIDPDIEYDRATRDRLRSTAQQVLAQLENGGDIHGSAE